MNCLNCNKEITSEYGKKFCSPSCSVKYNNYKRSKKRYYCDRCKINLVHIGYRNSSNPHICADCNKHPKIDTSVSLQELKNKYNLNQYHAKIRNHSRSVAKDLPKKCEVCGYDKHVEVCHIKELKEFAMTATLAEVNIISNLKILCPNHHWELDNLRGKEQPGRSLPS